jgi:hypothetical protein
LDPFVFVFEDLSFTNAAATPLVSNKLQDISQSQNNGGLPDAAFTQGNLFGDDATATAIGINTAFTNFPNNVGFGPPDAGTANNVISTNGFATFQNNVGAGLPDAGATQDNLFGFIIP